MAQHDYVIDNSTGANVRADINSVLQAIASNNSGSSAPSTTYALQSFANTTDSMLQLRNAANNAFVNLRKFDGTLPLPDGSASSPSLFFDDDTNTGLFSSAADTLNFTTGGAERMELGATTIFNESGADVDFRIEGDSEANLFYVDAGNNSVVLGDSAQIGFAVLGIKVDTSSQNGLAFKTSSNGAFGALRGLNAAGTEVCNIQFDTTNSAMNFRTANTTRMSIDSSGRLLIGGTTNVSNGGIEGSLEVLGTGSDDASVNLARFSNDIHPSFLCFSKSRNGSLGGNTIVQNNDRLGAILFFGSDGTDLSSSGAQIECKVDGTPAGDNMPARLIFKTTASGTSPSERMVISSNGNIGVGETSPSDNRFRCTSPHAFNFVAKSTNGNGGFHNFTGLNSSATITFEVNHNGDVKNTNNSYTAISDIKLKENIVDANSQWDDIKKIKVRNWNYKESTNLPTHKQIGVVAQELETVSVGLVSETDDIDVNTGEKLGTKTKSVKYSVLYMKAVKCLQEAQARIETLETKVAALESA